MNNQETIHSFLKLMNDMTNIDENENDYDDNDEDYDKDSDVNEESFSEIQSNIPVNKRKRRLNEEDRVKRCRERNRIHARNSRERKKNQMDRLQKRLQELISEKLLLQSSQSESSVASILISLSGNNSVNESESNSISENDITSEENISSCTSSKDLNDSNLYRINSCDESNDEIDEREKLLFQKDRSQCTTQELEIIRRERNRIHAKKTRLRKKRVLQEMEASIISLEEEVRLLRKQRRGACEFEDYRYQDQHSLINSYNNDNAFSIMDALKGFEALKYPNGFQKSKNLNVDMNFNELSATVSNLTSLKDLKQTC